LKWPAPGSKGPGGDAEIMAMVLTLDLDEVHAATVAEQKQNLPRPVADYARMLHRDHGKDVQATAQLAVQLREQLFLTPAVESLHARLAVGLAAIVPLEGEAFTRGFLDLMVKAHTEALQMVDRHLKAAQHERLKVHLTATRQMLEGHLKEAKRLQGERPAPRTTSR
jgi:putative membrane protein